MSDIQEDPSWWQAPDGRWYPPELAPEKKPPRKKTRPPEPKHRYGRFNRVLKRRRSQAPASSNAPAASKAPRPNLLKSAGRLLKGGFQLIPKNKWVLLVLFWVVVTLLGFLFGDDDAAEQSAPTPTPAVRADPAATPTEPPLPTPTASPAQLDATLSTLFGDTRKVTDDWYVSLAAPEDANNLLAPIQQDGWERDAFFPVLVRMEITYVGDQLLAPNPIPSDLPVVLFWPGYSPPLPGEEGMGTCTLLASEPATTHVVRGVPNRHSMCLLFNTSNLEQVKVRVGEDLAFFAADGTRANETPPRLEPLVGRGTVQDPLSFREPVELNDWLVELSTVFFQEDDPPAPNTALVQLVSRLTYVGDNDEGRATVQIHAFGNEIHPRSAECPPPANNVQDIEVSVGAETELTLITCFLVPEDQVPNLRAIVSLTDDNQHTLVFAPNP